MLGSRFGVVALLVLATSGCAVQLKPPPAPAAEMPAGATTKGAEAAAPVDASRVYVTTDVPARVLLASGGTVTTRRGGTVDVGAGTVLCEATPCVLTLPQGDYDIAFVGLADRDRESVIGVHVERPTEVINHTLGKHSASIAKPIGLAAFLVGAVALGVTLGLAEGSDAKATTALRTLGLASAATTAFGGALFFASPTYHQEGSTTQWSPVPGPVGRTVSAGVGLRF
jgi:hypothetical protein